MSPDAYLVWGGSMFALLLVAWTLYHCGERLRQSEERLRFVLQQSRMGHWTLDLVDHTAFRTLEHDRIFGYEALLPQWTYEMFLAHVLPDDRAEVDQCFKEAVAAQGHWSFECRIRRVDGMERWIWASGRCQPDRQGSTRQMAGLVQDITERKQQEVALHEAHERLALAQRAAAAGIWDWDMRSGQLPGQGSFSICVDWIRPPRRPALRLG